MELGRRQVPPRWCSGIGGKKEVAAGCFEGGRPTQSVDLWGEEALEQHN